MNKMFSSRTMTFDDEEDELSDESEDEDFFMNEAQKNAQKG